MTEILNQLLCFAPQCTFSERIPVEGGLFRYENRYPTSNGLSTGEIPFLTPPAIGDTVGLWHPDWQQDPPPETKYGSYRVVERSWSYADYSSGAWPAGERAPKVGPLLTLIVEPAEGPYRDEAPSEENEDA